MAFLGFSDFGSFANTAGSVMDIFGKAQGLLGSRGAAKEGLNIATSQKPTAAEARSNQLYEAMLDPSNPIAKMLSQYAQQAQAESVASQIREMQLADRRAQGMGRRPTFFSPERADEAVSFLTSRAAQGGIPMGLGYAQDVISQAAGGLKGLINPQVQRQEFARDARLNYLDKQQQQAGQWTGGVKDILGGIQGILQTVNRPQSSYTDIGWQNFLGSH